MIFKGFKKEAIEFLKELEVNNNKVWFEDRRDIWERYIHQPNIEFVKDMGESLQILVPTIQAKPKVGASLFKIYRDVRFSKDKTALKSKIGILFYQGLSHRMQCSSFYLHYDKDSYFVSGGIRNFKPELLKKYRNYIKIKKNREDLEDIIKDIEKKGYKLPEPKYKRLPVGFSKEDPLSYLSLYGAMYGYKEFKIDDIFFSEDIYDKIFNIFDDLAKMQHWVYNMQNSNIEI